MIRYEGGVDKMALQYSELAFLLQTKVSWLAGRAHALGDADVF